MKTQATVFGRRWYRWQQVEHMDYLARREKRARARRRTRRYDGWVAWMIGPDVAQRLDLWPSSTRIISEKP